MRCVLELVRAAMAEDGLIAWHASARRGLPGKMTCHGRNIQYQAPLDPKRVWNYRQALTRRCAECR